MVRWSRAAESSVKADVNNVVLRIRQVNADNCRRQYSDNHVCKSLHKRSESDLSQTSSSSLSAGLHDEERPQEEELDRALVPAEAKLHLVLRPRGPGRTEGRDFTGRELQRGGQQPHCCVQKPLVDPEMTSCASVSADFSCLCIDQLEGS